MKGHTVNSLLAAFSPWNTKDVAQYRYVFPFPLYFVFFFLFTFQKLNRMLKPRDE